MNVRPLKGFGSFEEALASGIRVTSGPLALTVIFSQTPQSVVYCGVSAPKRIAKAAVVRNRIKRLLRESLRQSLLTNTKCSSLGMATVVAIWRSSPQVPSMLRLHDVLPRVQNGLEKACKLYSNSIREEKP